MDSKYKDLVALLTPERIAFLRKPAVPELSKEEQELHTFMMQVGDRPFTPEEDARFEVLAAKVTSLSSYTFAETEPVASKLAAELLRVRTRPDFGARPISKEEYESLCQKTDVEKGIFPLRGAMVMPGVVELFSLPPAEQVVYDALLAKQNARHGGPLPGLERGIIGQLGVCEAIVHAVKCASLFDLFVAGRFESGVNVYEIEQSYMTGPSTGYWRLNQPALLARTDTFTFERPDGEYASVEFVGYGKADAPVAY